MAASITKRTNLSLGNVKGEAVLVDMGGDASFAFNTTVASPAHVFVSARDTADNASAVTYELSGNEVTLHALIADDPDVDVLVIGS